MPRIVHKPRHRRALSFQLRNISLATLLASAACIALLAQTATAQAKTNTRIRLLSPDGTAITSASAYISVRALGSYRSFSKRLDTTSAVHISVPDKDKTQLRIEVFARNTEHTLLGTRTFDLDAAGRWRKGLDAVRLDAPIIGLAGSVRTREGKPVANISVEVFARRGYRATTDTDGHFRIWMPKTSADKTPDNLKLQLRDRDYYLIDDLQMQPVQFGNRDAAITVLPAARMRFDAVDLPDKAHLWHGCRLVCENAETRKPHPAPPRIDLHGNQFLMPPGCWNLVFVRGNEEVLRLDTVFAEPGIENHDPRLMEFAWQRLGKLVSLDVRDHAGQPTADYFIVRHQASSLLSQAAKSAVSHLLLPPKGAKIGIRVKGGGEVDLGTITTDRTVNLGKR